MLPAAVIQPYKRLCTASHAWMQKPVALVPRHATASRSPPQRPAPRPPKDERRPPPCQSITQKSPTSCDAEPSVREAVPFGGPQARPSSGLMGHHHSGPSTRHRWQVGPQAVTLASRSTLCNRGSRGPGQRRRPEHVQLFDAVRTGSAVGLETSLADGARGPSPGQLLHRPPRSFPCLH